MVDFQISVYAEKKALQDDLLGFSINWVYGVKSSRMKSTRIQLNYCILKGDSAKRCVCGETFSDQVNKHFQNESNNV